LTEQAVERLLTARAAAEVLGVSERTVRRWIGDGSLAAEKRGGVFLIDLDAARARLAVSRAGRTLDRATELAELRGRYMEVSARLDAALREVEIQRARADRFEAVLYPPAARRQERPRLDEDGCPSRWSEKTYLGDGPWGA
jgi:excisionase family DNA binding protein